jgi:hypothetical protein
MRNYILEVVVTAGRTSSPSNAGGRHKEASHSALAENAIRTFNADGRRHDWIACIVGMLEFSTLINGLT